MKKTQKILLYAIALILLLGVCACSQNNKANQDINPIEVVQAVINKLEINPEDIGEQFYSEGDEEHILDEILLRMMFPPSFSDDDVIEYSMDLFEKYAVVQYEKYKPEIFEIGIFRVSHDNITTVENMCKERLVKARNEIFEYNAENAHYADDSKVYVFDNYIYYIISANSPAAYDTIKSGLALK